MEWADTLLIVLAAVLLASFEAIIIYRMARGDMDLRYLIADFEGYASLSRFQFLVFTFVIATGFVYLTIRGDGFPEIDEGVLLLLGISGTTYAMGKVLDRPATPGASPTNPSKDADPSRRPASDVSKAETSP